MPGVPTKLADGGLGPSVDDGPMPCCSAPVEVLVEGLVGVFCKPVWMALEEECDSVVEPQEKAMNFRLGREDVASQRAHYEWRPR